MEREDPIIDVMFETMIKTMFVSLAVVGLAPTLRGIVSATPVAQMLATQAYQGVSDARELNVSDELRWLDLIHERPYTPWISAFLVNKGPGDVEIAINYPANRFNIPPNGTITVSRAGAQERIAIIFYICDEGEMATVEVTGEY